MSGINLATPTAAAAASSVPSQLLTIVNPIDTFFTSLGANPFFIGIMMLLLNLGGRFLGMEISKNQEKFMTHPWVRRFFIFTVLFVATRNILVAFFLTILVLLLLAFLLNENSDLYLGGKQPAEVAAPSPGLSVEETEILRRLTEKQQRMMKAAETTQPDGSAPAGPETPVEEVYLENLLALQGGLH